jgi:hypothetical protein
VRCGDQEAVVAFAPPDVDEPEDALLDDDVLDDDVPDEAVPVDEEDESEEDVEELDVSDFLPASLPFVLGFSALTSPERESLR